MPSQASEQGLLLIRQTRRQSGIPVDNDHWLVEASRIVEESIDWPTGGPYASGCSLSTWKRFLRGQSISTNTFEAFCTVLKIDVRLVRKQVRPSTSESRHNWNEFEFDVSFCFGRDNELHELKQLILNQDRNRRCHLVSILGMGGIGKTTLCVRLVEQIENEFEYFYWRSLHNAPSFEETLLELIRFLDEEVNELPSNTSEQINYLVTLLRQRRCLLVLDGFESVLATGDMTRYLPNYEGYGDLIRQVSRGRHQSCLILTSREAPIEIAQIQGSRVHQLNLQGLPLEAAQMLLTEVGVFSATDEELQTVLTRYAGNPQALQIVLTEVQDYLNSDFTRFSNLAEEGAFPSYPIRDLFEQQFDRFLSTASGQKQEEVMYWLMIARDPVLFEDLYACLLSVESKRDLTTTLKLLRYRFMIETTSRGFTQQPVVIEYLTERFIEKIVKEIINANISSLKKYSFSSTLLFRDRTLQDRFILQPIVSKLSSNSETKREVVTQLAQHLSSLQRELPEAGYSYENICSLIECLNTRSLLD